jgi:uncharacterized DUF497 family protein
MTPLAFEWDDAKGRSNQRKHGVTFDEAATAFSDDRALVIDDPDHSRSEERFVLIGMSSRLRVLVVVHCHRESSRMIRIISARKATRSEQESYFQSWSE